MRQEHVAGACRSGMQCMRSGMQSTRSDMQGTRSRMQGVRSGVQGIQGMRSGMQGMQAVAWTQPCYKLCYTPSQVAVVAALSAVPAGAGSIAAYDSDNKVPRPRSHQHIPSRPIHPIPPQTHPIASVATPFHPPHPPPLATATVAAAALTATAVRLSLSAWHIYYLPCLP